MDAEFLALMPHSITVAPPDGTFTDRGQPNFGAGVAYACYIEPVRGEEIVRAIGGEERKASYRIYVTSTTALDPEGQLTLPTGYDPLTPPILAQSLVSDENGPHHVELLV